MRTNKYGILKGMGLVLLAGTLAACGSGLSGGSSSSSTTSGSGTGTSTTATGIQIGSGTGSSFKNGALGISTASLSAGGATTITADIVDANGTLYTAQSVTVNFNSPCFAANQATIVNSTGGSGTATTSTGTVIMTYTAKGCTGSDAITATASVNNQTITATGTLTVASATLGSIKFISATPSTISLKGMGGAGLQQTSTLIFTVEDSVGNPVQGANVTFALVSSTGDATLSASSGTSDANGNVQTIVKAGTHSGPVVVQASIVVSGQTIHTDSSGLAIQSGVPSEDHFSLSMSQYNVEGFEIDNNTATITASLSDRFSNPVPDGTTVSFIESNLQFGAGGRVDPSCNTTGGTCTVTWHSQNPRPTDIAGNQHVGFAYVLAFSNGEESFTDENGDGVFDDYRTCSTCALQAEPFDDIGEVYAASAEFAKTTPSSGYVNGEVFYDFNSDGIYNLPDGKWEGVNCQETAFGLCGTATSTGVGAYVCIIMSSSSAEFASPSPSTLIIPAGGGTFTVNIADINGNVPPKGTIISLNTANLSNGTAVLSPTNSGSTYVVPNTSCGDSVGQWPQAFSVAIAPTPGATNPMSGSLSVQVATPSGSITFITITIG